MKQFKQFCQEAMRIKLSGFGRSGASESVKKFMADFIENSAPNPLNDKSRIYNGVTIELHPDGREVHLSSIQSISPMSGAGTKAMKQLLRLASKHRVSINATAKAYSKDKRYVTDTEDLVRWYKKLGFQIVDDDYEDGDYISPDIGVDIKYFA